ncbi:MAG: AbrB/MazE/SpoVT family DNA-binding domain-containing protein [Thermomicrobiales bacterium]
MYEITTTVTRKGQITVPVEVRRLLGLKEGDKVAVSVPEPGSRQVMLRPVPSVAERTFGSIPPRGGPVKYDESTSMFGEGAVDEELRDRQRDVEGPV